MKLVATIMAINLSAVGAPRLSAVGAPHEEPAPVSALNVSIKQLFASMPDSLTTYLSHNNRLDMIDFMESDMKAEITNSFDEKSEMLALNDRYAKLRLSDALTMELRLLNDSTLCMVRTFGAEPIESAVEIYDSAWHKKGNVAMDLRCLSPMLIVSPDSLSNDEQPLLEGISKQAESLLVVASLSPDENNLTLSPFLPLLTSDEKPLFERCKRLITLKWTEGGYKND